MSVAVLNTPEEVGVRFTPRVPAEDTLTVQAPVILTFTSVVSVPEIVLGESVAKLWLIGIRILVRIKPVRK